MSASDQIKQDTGKCVAGNSLLSTNSCAIAREFAPDINTVEHYTLYNKKIEYEGDCDE